MRKSQRPLNPPSVKKKELPNYAQTKHGDHPLSLWKTKQGAVKYYMKEITKGLQHKFPSCPMKEHWTWPQAKDVLSHGKKQGGVGILPAEMIPHLSHNQQV